MTRSERIQKLGRAIREFRGRTSTPAGAIKVKWRTAPLPHRKADIERHLRDLSHTPEWITTAMASIETFPTTSEYDYWMVRLRWIDDLFVLFTRSQGQPTSEKQRANLMYWAELLADGDDSYFANGYTAEDAHDEELSYA